MVFLQFPTLFVIDAGSLVVMTLLPVTVITVLGIACARAVMMWCTARAGKGRSMAPMGFPPYGDKCPGQTHAGGT